MLLEFNIKKNNVHWYKIMPTNRSKLDFFLIFGS